MKISNKIYNAKLIINIIILILIYYFSFHIFPKLSFYNKLDYIGIASNARGIFFIPPIQGSNFDRYNTDELQYAKQQEQFLKQYFYYLNKNSDLITNAPCPRELLVNNLRNIQLYNDANLNFLEDGLKFNVRFSFYNFFNSSKKLDINKCFDYIFKENLNKYFILYRDKILKNLQDQNEFLKKIEVNDQIKLLIEINEQTIVIIKNYNFFIDPNINYSPKQEEDKSWPKIIAFIISLLIVVSINIGFKQLKRKQTLKLINKFMNS
jgi:hypothetical protein